LEFSKIVLKDEFIPVMLKGFGARSLGICGPLLWETMFPWGHLRMKRRIREKKEV